MIPRRPPDENAGPNLPKPLNRTARRNQYILEATRYDDSGFSVPQAGDDFDEHDLTTTAAKFLATMRPKA